jgi:preprotein translocase subunit Sec61beta
MSARKKRREEKAPMPAVSAGLMRFFEEETEGIKLRPEVIVILAVTLIVVCLAAPILFF